jgi:hypothetical protein
VTFPLHDTHKPLIQSPLNIGHCGFLVGTKGIIGIPASDSRFFVTSEKTVPDPCSLNPQSRLNIGTSKLMRIGRNEFYMSAIFL